MSDHLPVNPLCVCGHAKSEHTLRYNPHQIHARFNNQCSVGGCACQEFRDELTSAVVAKDPTEIKGAYDGPRLDFRNTELWQMPECENFANSSKGRQECYTQSIEALLRLTYVTQSLHNGDNPILTRKKMLEARLAFDALYSFILNTKAPPIVIEYGAIVKIATKMYPELDKMEAIEKALNILNS